MVATPIGNLSDMTFRAVSQLEECDLVLSEDTRRFRLIADKFNIKAKKVIALHQHTSEEKIRSILRGVDGTVCFVSDAGTPNIADPGGKLIKEALAQGFEVTALPGASALTYILSVSPWNTKEFVFVGFLPKKGTQNYLSKFTALGIPLYFFESPFRIRRTVELIAKLFPEAELIISREMTKIYEQTIISKASDIETGKLIEKGEYAVGLQLPKALR